MSTVPIPVERQEPTPVASPKTATRLMSLDLFRGATIAAMILVNDPGDEHTTYWPLDHAKWNGWTPTDLIFPFFLFIVGVAMAYSFTSRLRRGESREDLLKHVLWRGFILFALGLFLNGFPNRYHLATWRVYGVLQRIAICYVITAVLALFTKRRAWIGTAVACLAGYWIIMRYIPMPGFGTPGHSIPFMDPDRNLAAWLDRKVLAGHLYDVTRDPEGILSTIPAVATSILGLLTGDWLRARRSPNTKALGMAIAGILGVAVGEIFNQWFPINKNLWTSSFVIFTAGMALLALALCYWVLDIRQRRGGWTTSLLVFGMNPIAAYVFAGIVASLLDRISFADGLTLQETIYQSIFDPLGKPYLASLLFAIAFVVMCWIPMWILYRKKVFLKI